jgi:hypothetical protein
MKTKLLLLITTFFLQFANAQMDDKFYFQIKSLILLVFRTKNLV